MMQSSDDFTPTFIGCPAPLKDLLSEAQKLMKSEVSVVRGPASNRFFCMGIQLYALSRWLCNDYSALYEFCGDCFKSAADIVLTVDTDYLPVLQKKRLAMFWYGRAGHAYRATPFWSGSTYCFFRAYEIAIELKDKVLTRYFASEGWKTVTDRWLFLPRVFGYREPELELDEFILRLNGYDFQWLIWFLLQSKKFEIEVTKQTRDGGIDLIGSYHDKEWLINKRIIVQCKNPRNKGKKLTVSTVREMLGVYHLQKERPNEVMLVTTTDFTAEAKQTAANSGVPVILVNKDKLFELLQDVYEIEVFSEDPDIDPEERSILLMAGMREQFLDRLYERQKEVSVFGYFI